VGGSRRQKEREVGLHEREVSRTHLPKAAFADDFEVVEITGFDPDEEETYE